MRQSHHSNNRSEPRSIIEEFYSLEFIKKGLKKIYHFIVYDFSPAGVGILVENNSDALNFLKVGAMLNIKFQETNPRSAPQTLKTEVKHITPMNRGKNFRFHLVGFFILNPEQALSF